MGLLQKADNLVQKDTPKSGGLLKRTLEILEKTKGE